jgi:hypothetical protein
MVPPDLAGGVSRFAQQDSSSSRTDDSRQIRILNMYKTFYAFV